MIQYIPYVLTALAGSTLTSWATGSDDAWADADVFNSRMREIHTGILQLNHLFAKCKQLDVDTLNRWRSFVQLWAAYYHDVGKVWLSPNDETIGESKRFADNLNKWLAVYASKCGPIPSGFVPQDELSKPKPTDWAKTLLYVAGIFSGGYVLAQYLRSK